MTDLPTRIHDRIAADMPPLSHIECMTCGHREPHGFARHLKTGWPKCCGYTMRLFTVAEVTAQKAASTVEP